MQSGKSNPTSPTQRRKAFPETGINTVVLYRGLLSAQCFFSCCNRDFLSVAIPELCLDVVCPEDCTLFCNGGFDMGVEEVAMRLRHASVQVSEVGLEGTSVRW